MFWVLFIVFEGWVALQGFVAWREGFFTFAQARENGRPGVPVASFTRHGGMWGDVLFVSPLCARLLADYVAIWPMSFVGRAVLASTAITVVMLVVWADASTKVDEPFAREGAVTTPGLLHAVYMTGALAVVMLFLYGTAAVLVPRWYAHAACAVLAAHVVTAVNIHGFVMSGAVDRLGVAITLCAFLPLAVGWWRLVQ